MSIAWRGGPRAETADQGEKKADLKTEPADFQAGNHSWSGRRTDHLDKGNNRKLTVVPAIERDGMMKQTKGVSYGTASLWGKIPF